MRLCPSFRGAAADGNVRKAEPLRGEAQAQRRCICTTCHESRLPSPRLLLWLIVGVVLLYGVIYPNLHVVIASLQSDGGWSLANYRQVLSQNIVLESIFASVGVSVLTVLFCAAVGRAPGVSV